MSPPERVKVSHHTRERKPAPVTMKELYLAIQADTCTGWSLHYHTSVSRDLVRCFRLDPGLEATRPLGRCVRRRLEKLHPVNTQKSDKTLDNIRSSVNAALGYFRQNWAGEALSSGLSPEWAVLKTALSAERILQARLSRFLHWANANRIDPISVNDSDLMAFGAHLELLDIAGPDNFLRATAKAWNKARQIFPCWPEVDLASPPLKRNAKTPGWDILPPALNQQLTDYINFLAGGSGARRSANPFDIEGDDE